MARTFRPVHRIAPEVVAYQLGNDNDVAAFNGAAAPEVPLPATYVADRGGVIRYAHITADYTRRAEPEAVLAAARVIAESG
ncbi:hypothetical protein [Streptomyces antimycoticus]|uniref:hypothetical protein n=1 Tax=Streptomyces antimycoticus TaxID=68175 RepID=UPI001D13443B|nr:hypothetical protein [Streptomyces antimycoticus]